MNFIKKNAFKICIILSIVLSGVICFYSIWNYNGDRTNGQNIQRHQFGDNRGFNNNGMNRGGTNSGGKYSTYFAVYSTLFFGALTAIYFISSKKKINLEMLNEKYLLFIILFVGLLLRISAATLIQGHPSDLNLFKNWATSAATNLTKFYSNARSSDYPPLYIYVLFLVGKVINISAMSKYATLLIKIPSILADIVSAYLIYKLAKKYLSKKSATLLSAFYIFNPSIFINSTLWGQVDSFFTLLVISAIFLLSENRIGFSTIFFTAAVLMKPQGIIFLPVLFFELVRQKKIINFIKSLAIALITAMIIILPFFSISDPFWIVKLYSSTVGEYPYASVNAFNFFSLIGANYTNDSSIFLIFSYHTWGMIFIVLVTLFSWFVYIKGNSSFLAPAVALIQIAGVFNFSVGMHERYLFPAAALAILVYIYLNDKRILLIALGFSITSYVNAHSILFRTLNGVNSTSFGDELLFTALLNIFLFGYLIKVIWEIAVKGILRNNSTIKIT